MGKKINGASIIWESLIQEGVDVVFGYPGGSIIHTYDALTKYKDKIHHVLVRHEQGATHMADGYARASGKVGVVIVTSGPGATNTITGLATAMMDSSPIVCICGQVGTMAIGGDAFQEVDVTGVTLPVTKHNYLVTDIKDLAATIREAFYVARTGRPGPVLVDVPRNVQIAEMEFEYPTDPINLLGYHPPERATAEVVAAASALINQAEKPVILAGHGVLLSGAMKEILDLCTKANIPVTTTLLGISGVPASHPLNIGMMGMHGEAAANHAIQEADLLIACGMRFDDRVTGNLKTYSPNSKKIHIDIDAAELNKNVKVDIGINTDLRTALQQINPSVTAKSHADWFAKIRDWQEDSNERDIINAQTPGFHASQAIRGIWEGTNGKAVVVSDVGQHQMLEAQYYPHDEPRTLLTSGGLGTMGFGLPAAIGASFCVKDKEVWVVVGDGSIQMNIQELGTAVQEKANVKICIINNGYLGMVRQWQQLFYGERYSETPISSPDYLKIAEAYGMPGYRVMKAEDTISTIRQAQAHQGPVLIEFMVEAHDMVYPMVSPGADLHNMIRRPYKQFDNEETF